MLDLKEIETRVENHLVLILKVSYEEDPLMVQINQMIGATSTASDSKLPIFPITSASQDRILNFQRMLHTLTREANECSMSNILIGLVPISSPYDEGVISFTTSAQTPLEKTRQQISVKEMSKSPHYCKLSSPEKPSVPAKAAICQGRINDHEMMNCAWSPEIGSVNV